MFVSCYLSTYNFFNASCLSLSRSLWNFKPSCMGNNNLNCSCYVEEMCTLVKKHNYSQKNVRWEENTRQWEGISPEWSMTPDGHAWCVNLIHAVTRKRLKHPLRRHSHLKCLLCCNTEVKPLLKCNSLLLVLRWNSQTPVWLKGPNQILPMHWCVSRLQDSVIRRGRLSSPMK